MSDCMDPAIKLFGRTIPRPDGVALQHDKDFCEETTSTEVNGSTSALVELEQGEPNGSSFTNNDNEDNHQTSIQNDKATVDLKPDQDQSEADASNEGKLLKKPDKILPCPRCNSMDTKFCYYNNYNVNQPRHFCKNCQRYWTAGGMMRNVPVGAGRRKNKHSGSYYRQIMMPSDSFAASTLIDSPDSSHQTLPCSPVPTRPVKGNGTVQKFGQEAPLCESMSSVINIREQKRNAEFSHVARGDDRDEPSSSSSVVASNSVENGFPENPVQIEQNNMQGYCTGVRPLQQLQCYSGPPWPYPWVPGWKNVAAAAVVSSRCSEAVYGQENVSPTPIPWSGPQPIMAAPAFSAPTIPFPFLPASFWGWTSGTWNLPWVGTNGGLLPTSSVSNSVCSGNGSPTLGKHSRDVSSQVEEKTEKSLWIPKTLRIDDPDEAAKSSIWATLGIKHDEVGIFKDFRPKSEDKDQASDASQVLHANPVALSRFQTFQEST